MKPANLRRLKNLEGRIGNHSLEQEAKAVQLILERIESAKQQVAIMNSEDHEASVEAYRAEHGTVREQIDAHIESVRNGGPTLREQVLLFIEERKQLREPTDFNC